MGQIKWSNPLPGNLRVAEVSLRQAVWNVVQKGAIDGQNHMRTSAPWTDRTGNARQGLFGRAFRQGQGYVIVLYGTVEYQIWLEVANSGQYKVIEPSLPIVGAKVMNNLRGVMATMRRVA